MASRLKDKITSVQPPSHDASEPPSDIPDGIRSFLGAAVDLPLDYVDGYWKAFSDLVWTYEDGKTEGADAEVFTKHGLASRMLLPPFYYCTTPGCTSTTLLRDKYGPSKVVLYTLSDGACATFASNLSCSTCKSRYYPNYVVQNVARTYYSKIPDEIQVVEHQYIERSVLNLFTALMLISWTSSTNGARIYNESLSQSSNFPDHPDWMDTSCRLRPEHIWDGFIILSLLEDHEARSATLRVSRTGDQHHRRFTVAGQR
ncbi:hypothetical protein B0H19DRAFT_916896 [Mycena capillaripes]|nr:hypothetical protein B0H19DRAFT_916896 [Mycena capillaripes]